MMEDSQDLRQQALEAARVGDFARARGLLRQLHEENPDDPEVLFYMGSVAYKTGNLADAEVYWVKASRLAPEDARTANWLQQVRADLPTERRVPTWEEAFQLSPDVAQGQPEGTVRASFRQLFPVALAAGAFIGFLFHFMGRFFWIPIVPGLVVGVVAAVGALLCCGPDPTGGRRLMGIALLLALLSCASIHVWNMVEFYFWGGAQRLYELEMAGTEDIGIIRAQPPIESPTALLSQRVGRTGVPGYFAYEGQVGRVIYMSGRRRVYLHSDTQRLVRLSGGFYWLEVLGEFGVAALTAATLARKFQTA